MNILKNFIQIILITILFISNIIAQDFWTKLPGPEGGWIWSSCVDRTGGIYDGTIFIGTYGGGIFRSADNGNTWEEVNNGLGNFYIYDIVVGSSVYVAADGGIYRSDDNGNTWQIKNNGLPGGSWGALVIDQSGGIFAGNLGDGIYYSTDNGENWTYANGPGLTDGIIRDLAINNAGELFAGGNGGMYRSGDNGANWTRIVNGITWTDVLSLSIFQNGPDENIIAGTPDYGVFISTNNGDLWQESNNGLTDLYIYKTLKNNANELFLGTRNGVFKSTDFGLNWVQSGITNESVYSLTVNNANDIFSGTRIGNFRSVDNGSSWNLINNGFISGPIFDVDVNASNEIFALSDNGVFISSNNGNLWTKKNIGLIDTTYLEIRINDQGDIFVGTAVGIYRSDDNGDNWAYKGLAGEMIQMITFNTNGHIFAGTWGTPGGVYRSVDNGDNWTHLVNLAEDDIGAIAINQNDNTIFAGEWGNGVFRSTDNGDTWTPVNNGLTGTHIRTLAVNESGDLFVGTAWDGIFRSYDNGDNWTQIINGLFDNSIREISINSIGHLYIGTNYSGIFFSNDNGDNWIHLSGGMPYPRVYDFSLDNNDYLFAATSGGMFYSVIPSVLPQPLLSLPTDGATDIPINPNLEWSTVFGAESYHLQVSDVNDFSNIEFEQGGITANMQQISGLNTGTNYYWRVRAENFTGASSWSGEWSFTTFPYSPTLDIASGDILFPTHDNISNYEPQDYRIVGIPGRIDNDMRVDQLLGGVHKSDWQAYRDNGTDSQNPDDYFIEFDGIDEFRFGGGRAFWIINKGNLNINKNGVETAILDSDGDTEIHLHPGWNLITNPFDHQIEWWKIQQSNSIGPIHYFDGTGNWQNSDDHFSFFEPYIGYYVFTQNGMTLFIPYIATFQSASSRPVNHTWKMDVSLSVEGKNISSSKIGVSKLAQKSLDELDYRKPRAIGPIPSIYFNRPE